MLPGITALSASASVGALVITASKTEITKSMSSTGDPKTVTTGPVTVTASGGAGGYTFAWTRKSGSTVINATSPAAATTSFSGLLDPYDELSAVFTCTVTDAEGVSKAIDVNVSLYLVYVGGGTA